MKILKARKKPVVVECIQFINYNYEEIILFTDGEAYQSCNHRGCGFGDFKIITLEGVHIIRDGDYIIKGMKGEFYPCKPEVFAMTYDLIGEV